MPGHSIASSAPGNSQKVLTFANTAFHFDQVHPTDNCGFVKSNKTNLAVSLFFNEAKALPWTDTEARWKKTILSIYLFYFLLFYISRTEITCKVTSLTRLFGKWKLPKNSVLKWKSKKLNVHFPTLSVQWEITVLLRLFGTYIIRFEILKEVHHV